MALLWDDDVKVSFYEGHGFMAGDDFSNIIFNIFSGGFLCAPLTRIRIGGVKFLLSRVTFISFPLRNPFRFPSEL